jgi:nuclear protein localization family protein 4
LEDNSNYAEGYRAVLEGIYEPSQAGSEDEAAMLDSGEGFLAQVDLIAERLGLERIGWIFTSLGRDFLLTGKEAVIAAEFQWKRTSLEHYTKYPLSKFVTCIVKLRQTDAVTDVPEAEPEALMVSDQAVGMVRDRLLRVDDQREAKKVYIREAELANELLPTVLESYKEVKRFDPDWFVVRVNQSTPLKPKSFFKHSHFSRENRVNSLSVDYFQPRYFSPGEKSYEKFSDFHLLLFIAEFIDIDTALVICDCIRDSVEIDEDLQELVKSSLQHLLH